MKKLNLITLALIALTLHVNAQEPAEKKGYKFDNNFDLALSTAGNQHAAALSWTKFHSLGKMRQFKVGYGLKFTSHFGKDVYYTTAPAILTKGEEGPQVLFLPERSENIDTLHVGNAQTNALNISLNLQYTIKEKLDIGFTGDAAGISFGSKTTGKYTSRQPEEKVSNQTAAPTQYNLLLVDDNDIGTLNSEFYVRYWFHPKWGIRAGVRYLFTEYTTDKKLRFDNDRFRNKSMMGLLGITFSPYR
jgi:hypothetical protein